MGVADTPAQRGNPFDHLMAIAIHADPVKLMPQAWRGPFHRHAVSCGLAAWLAGVRHEAVMESRLDQGYWLEQTIFQTLQVWRSLAPHSRRLHFWRDRAGNEVDFILEQDGGLVALEVKLAARADLRDADDIRAWRATLKERVRFVRGAVLHAGEARPLGDDLFALPWGWMVPKI